MIINQEIKNFANHLADLSSEIAIKYFRTNNDETAKEDDTPVTKADREIEKVIRMEIEDKFPNHGIIGEEYGIKKAESDFTWILDPIDGTSSFIIGRPLFGTLIALSYKGKALLGIMNQPITKERWIGIENEGAWLNGRKIQTRNCTKISNAVMCSSAPFYFQEDSDKKIFKKICNMTKYQSLGGVIYGGDCYSYVCLASGFVDIVINSGLKVFDYAALLPIIQMAGGMITDWQGNDPELKSNAKLIACSNKILHSQLLEAINQ